MGKKEKLSAYIICLDEERKIEKALKSLQFADEIIIVDSGSKDRTVEIAKKYTDKIYHNDWVDFSVQRNFALDKCEHDWIFTLDSDEEATPELIEKIKLILESGTDKTWFKVRRYEHYNGKLIRYCAFNPSYQIRLFRKSHGRYIGKVHEYPKMKGEMGVIEEAMNHYGLEGTVSELMDKGLIYAKMSAEEKFAAGEKRTFLYKYFSGLAMFLKSYITRKGFLDGYYGLCLAFTDAWFFYKRQDYLLKLWREKES